MSPAKSLIKHSSIYALGNVSRQVVGFVMLPIYTQFLAPSDYGVVGLLVLMVSLTELLFGGHMAHAVSKFYYDQDNDQDRHRVISTALIMTSAISLAAVILVFVLRNPASSLLFGDQAYSLVVAIFGVQILMHALENYALVYIRIQQRPWFFVSASGFKMLLQLGFNVYFVVLLEKGVMGVALSGLFSSSIFCFLMTGYLVSKIGLGFGRTVAAKLLRFSWPLWIGGLAGVYIGSANRYFVRIFSSLHDVGLLELASKFGSIIPVLIWLPFAQYWQVERFRIYRQENARDIYQQVFKFICSLLSVAAIGIIVFGETLIKLMADEEFYASGRAIPFLVVSGIMSSATIFCNFSFLVKEETGWMSRNSYITAIIITIFNFALIPYFGFVGAAAASAFTAALQFLIVHHVGKKFYDMGIAIRHLYVNVFVVVMVALLVPLLRQQSLLEDFLVKTAIGAVALIVLVALFMRELLFQRPGQLSWSDRLANVMRGER